MPKIVLIGAVLRNVWKKSVVGVGALEMLLGGGQLQNAITFDSDVGSE